ncbi:MAG: monovalent cation:H+ antiporter-2, family [Thermoplasmata archaeon]|nr:monovalent cation:H+ antiporter-2, family [Thermoplasmata archaeon]
MAELLWVLAGLVALLAATGWVCQRLRLPPALGYLLVGVSLPETVTDERLQEIVHLDEAAHIAVLILLFFIGLELELRTLRRILRETRVVSIFNILVPGLAVMGLARLAGWPLVQAAILGIALSLSSTIFGERLSAGTAFPGEARKRMFGVLLAEDLAAGALLALVAVLAGGAGGGEPSTGILEPVLAIGVLLVALVVLAAVALLAVPRIVDALAILHQQELVILGSGALLLLFSAAGDWAGSAELGAFLAGMAVAEAGSRFVVRNALSGLRSISLALFFFASGLVVEPEVALAQWPLVLACVAAVLAAKLVVHVPAAMGAGLPLADSLRVGFGMATVGEFSLILVIAASDGGVAHADLAATVAGTIVGLLLLAPPLLLLAPRAARALLRLPKGVIHPAHAFVQTLRRRSQAGAGKAAPSTGLPRLAAGAILVGTIFAVAFALDAWLSRQLADADPLYLRSILYGAAFALSAPLAVQLFRSYRRLSRSFVAPGDTLSRLDRFKLGAADALVALVFVLLCLVVLVAAEAPVLLVLSSMFLAVIVAVVAWRRLTQAVGTVSTTLARVLGADLEVPPVLLDHAIQTYGWDFRVLALALSPASTVAGRSLGESRIREATGATVAVIKRGPRELVNPAPGERLRPGDTVVLMGDPSQLARAEALLEAGEEPLRMAAETRSAAVTDLAIEDGSWFAASRPTQEQLEARTGASVLGYWPKDSERARPWTGAGPAPGDRLVVLGTAFQVARLAKLLQAPSDEDAAA